jgi:phosphohistidine swiveling domain-containing protein
MRYNFFKAISREASYLSNYYLIETYTKRIKELGADPIKAAFIVGEENLFSIYRDKESFDMCCKSIKRMATEEKEKVLGHIKEMESINKDCTNVIKSLSEREATKERIIDLLEYLERFAQHFWKHYIFVTFLSYVGDSTLDKEILKRIKPLRKKMYFYDIEPELSKYLSRYNKKFGASTTLCLSFDELRKSIEGNSLLDVGRQRYRKYVLYSEKGKSLKVYTGGEADDFMSDHINVILNKTNELKGLVACEGEVMGEALVTRKVEDIIKAEKGLILITSMTSPQMSPYLEKFKGFVTDEGGVGSHVGIYSREMKIPAVMGTKYATQTFKNGDLVKVDANKGIVRKINYL